MDGKTYQKMTLLQLKGRKAKALRPLSNGFCQVAEGTTLTIDDKQGGFRLTSEPCPHCGVRVYISKVEPGAVELIEE